MAAVYKKYPAIDPSVTERYANLLLNPLRRELRPLEAAKLLLPLARKAQRGGYVSPEGKSSYQLLEDFISLIEKHSDEVGMDVDTNVSNATVSRANETVENKEQVGLVPVDDELVQLAGPAISVNAEGQPMPPYDEDEDPQSAHKLNISSKRMAGSNAQSLTAPYKCLNRVAFTIRDFNQIFEAYTEFDEGLLSALMHLEEEEQMTEDDEVEETQEELDQRMKDFEDLADRRPLVPAK